MVNEKSSLESFQMLNREIYLVCNDQNYSNQDIFSWMYKHITRILKCVRKNKLKEEEIRYNLCMAFSWALSLANRYHIEIAEEMWKRFPGVCPYCVFAPCRCKERRSNRRNMNGRQKGERPISMCQWQEMFGKIYPNKILDQAVHLAEEAGEVNETMRNYTATHKEDWFTKTAEELVDVFTNLFGISNCLRYNLADGFANYFSAGCPRCNRRSCRCGYFTEDPFVSEKR